ncbi:hypothetical protein BD779DRAFT_1473299 [Infundibulicybe gibba]|nr:hypothetical protein BD779DRAFT_1473299 [Infundibulicybe gibba]
MSARLGNIQVFRYLRGLWPMLMAGSVATISPGEQRAIRAGEIHDAKTWHWGKMQTNWQTVWTFKPCGRTAQGLCRLPSTVDPGKFLGANRVIHYCTYPTPLQICTTGMPENPAAERVQIPVCIFPDAFLFAFCFSAVSWINSNGVAQRLRANGSKSVVLFV